MFHIPAKDRTAPVKRNSIIGRRKKERKEERNRKKEKKERKKERKKTGEKRRRRNRRCEFIGEKKGLLASNFVLASDTIR